MGTKDSSPDIVFVGLTSALVGGISFFSDQRFYTLTIDEPAGKKQAFAGKVFPQTANPLFRKDPYQQGHHPALETGI